MGVFKRSDDASLTSVELIFLCLSVWRLMVIATVIGTLPNHGLRSYPSKLL